MDRRDGTLYRLEVSSPAKFFGVWRVRTVGSGAVRRASARVGCRGGRITMVWSWPSKDSALAKLHGAMLNAASQHAARLGAHGICSAR